MRYAKYQAGDKVVFTRDKATAHPGPRAKNVYPSPAGEMYHYQVDKYWLVRDTLPDGTLVVVTRRGKEHRIRPDDPRLRKANLWERLVKSHLFPELDRTQPTPRAA